MEKGSVGLGVNTKKSDLLSSTARLDFLAVAGIAFGVRLAPEIDIDNKFKQHELLNAIKPQEYIH